jgi:hypothetical protein
MHLESVSHGTTFSGETAGAAHEYYHLTRSRSGAAELVLSAMSSFVSSVMIVKGVRRDELFEKYDLKLWSYDDNLAWFTLSTLPSAAALTLLYAAYRIVQGLRGGLSL